MPTYGYRCDTNGHEFEVTQSITEPPLTACVECGAPVHRIFYPVGIVFKGQGFYKTDNRSSSSGASGGSSGSSSASDSAKADSGAAPAAKPDPKPETPAKADSKP